MREIHHGGEAFAVEDYVAEALDGLAVVLGEAGLAADVALRRQIDDASIRFTLGRDLRTGKSHTLRARLAAGEGSHLGLEDV